MNHTLNLEHVKCHNKYSTEGLRLVASLWLKITQDLPSVLLDFQVLIFCQNSSIWTEISHRSYLRQYTVLFMSLYFNIFLRWGKKTVFFKSPWIFTQTILALLWIKEVMLNLSTSLAFQSELSFWHIGKKSLDIFSIFSQLFQLILF